MKTLAIAIALAALALAADFDAAFAQTPDPTATPAPITTRRNLTVSVSENVVAYVYPNGVGFFILRWLISPGDDQVTARFPDASNVVTFSLAPAAASFAAGHDVVIRPAIVPGTGGPGAKGWGRGLGIGVCQCFRGLDHADQAAELALDWTLTTELNPEYVTNPSAVERKVKLNGFLEMDSYSTPESRVRAAIADVNRDQPAALLDGRFLSQAGEVYLASYALDLQFLLPDLYLRGAHPIAIPTPGTFDGVDVPVAGMDADPSTDNPVEMGIEGIAAFTGLRSTESTGLLWAAFAIALTVGSAILTRNAIFPVCTLVFALLAGVAFGWTPMWVGAVIIVMAALAAGWIFWLKKGVGS